MRDDDQQATVKGLRRALDLLIPDLQLYRAGLEAHGPDEFGGRIREMFRGYARAIGTLRWELDEIEGRTTTARFCAEEDFAARLEVVDSLRGELKGVVDPVRRDQLLRELEAAEQIADAAMIEFASE